MLAVAKKFGQDKEVQVFVPKILESCLAKSSMAAIHELSRMRKALHFCVHCRPRYFQHGLFGTCVGGHLKNLNKKYTRVHSENKVPFLPPSHTERPWNMRVPMRVKFATHHVVMRHDAPSLHARAAGARVAQVPPVPHERPARRQRCPGPPEPSQRNLRSPG